MGGEFVAAMEDVLERYALPHDARFPTVCLDEKPVVLRAEARVGLPCAPGQVARRDDEDERHGTANLFVMVEPLADWRHVAVTERRTQQEYAECLRYLVEERSPDAERSTRPFPRAKPDASWLACTASPRPNTAVGSIRPRSRAAAGEGVGGGAQRTSCDQRLALHLEPSAQQAHAPLPVIDTTRN
jgi:hypothetical protein